MKKIYFLAAGLIFAGTVSAQQTIVDGGFEGMFVLGTQFGYPSNNIGAFIVLPNTIIWSGVMGKEDTSPISGAQSALMVSVDDSVAAGAIGSPVNKISGFMQQTYEGAFDFTNPNTMDFTFQYEYTPSGIDTAFVMVSIYDTTVTANNGLIWGGISMMDQATTGPQSGSITTWVQIGSGTANQMYITFGSSISSYLDDVEANVGSRFVVDDVELKAKGVSINEVAKVASKVYPNPVSDVLNIEVSNGEATSISIFGLDGKLVKTELLSGVKNSINVENLNSGMYLYTITTKNGDFVKSKFLKN